MLDFSKEQRGEELRVIHGENIKAHQVCFLPTWEVLEVCTVLWCTSDLLQPNGLSPLGDLQRHLQPPEWDCRILLGEPHQCRAWGMPTHPVFSASPPFCASICLRALGTGPHTQMAVSLHPPHLGLLCLFLIPQGPRSVGCLPLGPMT